MVVVCILAVYGGGLHFAPRLLGQLRRAEEGYLARRCLSPRFLPPRSRRLPPKGILCCGPRRLLPPVLMLPHGLQPSHPRAAGLCHGTVDMLTLAKHHHNLEILRHHLRHAVFLTRSRRSLDYRRCLPHLPQQPPASKQQYAQPWEMGLKKDSQCLGLRCSTPTKLASLATLLLSSAQVRFCY